MSAANRVFSRGELLPSYLVNREQDFIGPMSANFRVRALNGTTLQVPAGAGQAAAVVGIQGRWRWMEGTVTKAMPGGAAGTFSVFAVAKENAVNQTPQTNLDSTDYSFDLVVTSGATPTIVPGTLDVYRLVAYVEWDGTRIVAVVPTVGNSDNTIPLSPTADTAAQTPLRVRGPVGGGLTADLAEFRDQPGGTVMAAIGSTGQIRTPSVLIGGDVLVGRSRADHASLGAGDLLDLSSSGGQDASTTGTAGDKVILGSGIGFGVQSNRLVAYVPAGQGFSVRQTVGAGNKSSGTDAVTLGADGSITATSLSLSGTMSVAALNTTGNLSVGGMLGVTGASTFSSGTFSGALAANGGLTVTGTLTGMSNVSGTGSFVLAGSPTLTGTPLAPTAAVDTNTGQIATTQYVVGQGYLKSTTAGTTYQPLNAQLTALAALATTGIVSRTAANTFTPRSIAGTVGQVTVTNGDGVGGNPTISLPGTITQPTTFSAVGTGLAVSNNATVSGALTVGSITAAGSISGVTTLAMGGALSGVTSLAMGGALTGATTGAFSGAVTVGSLASATGGLDLTGASTNVRLLVTGTPVLTATSTMTTLSGQLTATGGVFSSDIRTTRVIGDTTQGTLYLRPSAANDRIIFESAAGIERGRFDASDNFEVRNSLGVGFGNGVTPSYTLDVNGSARIGAVGSGVGFLGATPTGRAAARTMTGWNSGLAKRSIDRSAWSTQDLFDFVMTMAYDHQQFGLFA